jgi:hypothetical protein
MNREDIEQAIYERTRRFVSEDVQDAILELIVAEREACAKVCDELADKHGWEGSYANECAIAIRARETNDKR